MAGLPDIEGHYGISREFSPDGTLAIDTHRAFDMRDIHEIDDQSRLELYDAVDGRLLLGLTAINRRCAYRWSSDPGVDIRLSHPHLAGENRIVVTRGNDGWQAAMDGGMPGPIGHVTTELARLPDPAMGGAPPTDAANAGSGTTARRAWRWAALLILAGGVVWFAMTGAAIN